MSEDNKLEKIRQLLASIEQGIRECRAILRGETHE